MENETYKGYTIKVENDEIGEDPREWDNLGKMVCFHNSYKLGDKDNEYNTDSYNGWDEMKRDIVKADDVKIIAPLYLYDHSGLRIKIGSFYGLLPQGHAEFDSGQVGFIYATADAIRKFYQVKKITKKILAKAEVMIKQEVKDYDTYISGSVLQYCIEDADGEVVDSCGGYFEYEALMDDAKRYIDQDIKDKEEAKEKKLKGYIKNEVPLIYRTA